MADIAKLHHQALDETGRIVAGIPEPYWAVPTPCPEWTARELVNHLVAGNWWASELARGATIEEVGTRLDGDVLGADPAGAYQRSADAAAAAFETPGALDAPCAVSYGPVSGSVYAGHRFIDVLVHGWDLAVATGQDATLDPELARECFAVVEPQAELLRASGMFGEARATAGDEDAARRLLALLGRASN